MYASRGAVPVSSTANRPRHRSVACYIHILKNHACDAGWLAGWLAVCLSSLAF